MIINQKDFARIASAAASVSDLKSPVAAVRMSRIEASEGVLSIMATDFSIWLTLRVPCEGDLPAIMVPADKLADAVKLASETLYVSLEDGNLIIKGGKSKRKLATQDAIAFPLGGEATGDSFELQAERISEGAAFSLPFVGMLDYLSGVCIDGDGVQARMLATDGKALAEYGLGDCGFSGRASVSAAFLKSLAKAADKGAVTVTIDERKAMASWPNGSLIGPLLIGQFPDTDRIVPQSFDLVVVAEAKELLASSSSVQGLGTKGDLGKPVTLAIGEGIEVSAKSTEGEATDEIQASVEGGELTIQFNSMYLDRALSAFGDATLRMQFGKATTPVKLSTDAAANRFVIIMPRKM